MAQGAIDATMAEEIALEDAFDRADPGSTSEGVPIVRPRKVEP